MSASDMRKLYMLSRSPAFYVAGLREFDIYIHYIRDV